jgi:hypothetical protein
MLKKILPCTMLLLSAILSQTATVRPSGQRFEVAFPKEMSAAPLDGHVLLLISNNDTKEPHFQISFMTAESQQVFGVDVDALAPGAPAVVDSATLGYPAESLNDVPAGDYWVQAVLNIYETFQLGNGRTLKLPPDKGEGQHWAVKPGNLYSKPLKMHLDPRSGLTVRISLTEKMPSIADNPKGVDSLLGWSGANEDHAIVDNAHQVLGTSHLSRRRHPSPRRMGRASRRALPADRRARPLRARSPRCDRLSHPAAHRQHERRRLASCKERLQALSGLDCGPPPRVIVLTIQHATPYFDDSYAVNSENVGPYGDAITQELIPYVEKQFRSIGQGWARAVYGGSTGGWESLASQVFYPDFYNGAWVFCPDVVDFRAYMTMNLYDDSNAFWIESPYARVPRPSVRQPDGLILSTMEQMNRYEIVQGTHSRSGEQLDTWQAVFSSVGDDGYPKPIFNKRTGEIDH